MEFYDARKTNRYDIACYSGIGARESQQDSGFVAANDDSVFAVVCDGMGGMDGGNLASRTAVDLFTEHYITTDNSTYSGLWMQKAIREADKAVFSLCDQQGNRLGAGTTLVAISINQNFICWIASGDSRIYIFRGDEMVRVTTDHNYFYRLEEQLEKGEITKEKYYEEAVNGDALISFLGMGGLTMIDVNEEPIVLKKGDVILLCTDGLYRTMPDEYVKYIIRNSRDMSEVSQIFDRTIRDHFNSRQDNYTFVLIKINEV